MERRKSFRLSLSLRGDRIGFSDWQAKASVRLRRVKWYLLPWRAVAVSRGRPARNRSRGPHTLRI